MQIRALLPGDAEAFQRVRLQGLQECPSSFASSHAEELPLALSVVAQRLSPQEEGVILGAFVDQQLVGIVGLQREQMRKLSHKAVLWGMYVVPEARVTGVGRELVSHALAFASEVLRVRQVILGVNARNAAALALYSAMGFAQFGREPAFMLLEGELHDEVQMVRFLEAAT